MKANDKKNSGNDIIKLMVKVGRMRSRRRRRPILISRAAQPQVAGSQKVKRWSSSEKFKQIVNFL